MRNELSVQTKIVNTLEDMGGHAFKCNNRFKAGILDIHYTLDGGPGREVQSGFIEVKFDRRATLGKLSIAATPKQQQFATKERNAGGVVHGIWFIQHAKNRNLWAMLYFDPAAKGNEFNGEQQWRSGRIKWSEELVRYL